MRRANNPKRQPWYRRGNGKQVNTCVRGCLVRACKLLAPKTGVMAREKNKESDTLPAALWSGAGFPEKCSESQRKATRLCWYKKGETGEDNTSFRLPKGPQPNHKAELPAPPLPVKSPHEPPPSTPSQEIGAPTGYPVAGHLPLVPGKVRALSDRKNTKRAHKRARVRQNERFGVCCVLCSPSMPPPLAAPPPPPREP